MKICASCGSRFLAQLEQCPGCGCTAQCIDGFPSYAPELAHGGGGFDAAHFPVLAGLEEGNFWFRARNELILWALRKFCAGRFDSYLEIGCGTGFVLHAIHRNFPRVALTAGEVFVGGLAFAAQRVPGAHLIQMDARRIPFVDEFDVLGAFDVIEHIPEDEAVLQQAWQALRPGGTLILTVPQHPWLWSAADTYASHERRYTASGLRTLVRRAGFEVVRSTSFTTFLLPAMFVSRLRLRWPAARPYDPLAEFRISPAVNGALERILAIERKVIRWGADFPWGGSRLLVARKPAAGSAHATS